MKVVAALIVLVFGSCISCATGHNFRDYEDLILYEECDYDLQKLCGNLPPPYTHSVIFQAPCFISQKDKASINCRQLFDKYTRRKKNNLSNKHITFQKKKYLNRSLDYSTCTQEARGFCSRHKSASIHFLLSLACFTSNIEHLSVACKNTYEMYLLDGRSSRTGHKNEPIEMEITYPIHNSASKRKELNSHVYDCDDEAISMCKGFKVQTLSRLFTAPCFTDRWFLASVKCQARYKEFISYTDGKVVPVATLTILSGLHEHAITVCNRDKTRYCSDMPVDTQTTRSVLFTAPCFVANRNMLSQQCRRLFDKYQQTHSKRGVLDACETERMTFCPEILSPEAWYESDCFEYSYQAFSTVCIQALTLYWESCGLNVDFEKRRKAQVPAVRYNAMENRRITTSRRDYWVVFCICRIATAIESLLRTLVRSLVDLLG
ncbi:hypothetical protein SARC_06627 [Sphaeroforma arctica JP610]|uniref:FZ domain-containing protein n=1 Tax=Sphaeroforma arctica JP610 TaxID=667725 RepID=A0A0L0FWL9_9EUKA|nr:hypothetical protein SARC_06627 [Sphaeroforma arctica JP610]KNC81034.1 hypothetical protein SARC_06627 [Sphaeroforma arctica JP610]|eukprot:XP_014154936.1 hypothetical protein SARC_06627 [Sphaeroforma arctica JP610]